MRNALNEGITLLESWLPSVGFKDAPGSLIAISHEGNPVLKKEYGYASVLPPEEMTQAHQYQIGSQSKVFTAIAISQLAEKGLLDLREPVVTYVPELVHANDIRLGRVATHHLLTHSAGISRDGARADFWELNGTFPKKEALLGSFISEPLIFDPEETMKYSNSGYGLLGVVIERVSNMPYSQYIRRHILTPLKLGETSIGRRPHKGPVSRGYAYHNDSSPIDEPATHAFTPATGLYSTTDNLLSLYQQFLHPSDDSPILNKDSLVSMATPYGTMPHSGGIEYGYGIDIAQDGGSRIIGHGGGFPGHRSGTIVDSSNEIVTTAFANATDIDAFDVAINTTRILRYFLNNGGTPRTDRSHFNTKFSGLWQDRQIVTAGDTVISINPNSRDPLSESNIEILTPIDDSTLRITQASGFGQLGELVEFPSDEPNIVIYGGRRFVKNPPQESSQSA